MGGAKAIELIAIVTGWIALSLAVGVWSWRRGGRVIVMFAVSLLLTPLVGIALEVRRGHVISQVAEPLTAKTLCPGCGESVRRDATQCPHCRKRLSAPALVDPSEWNAW